MLNLDGLELDEATIAKIKEQNSGLIAESEVEGLRKNRDELLSEKKAAQEKSRAIAEEAEAERLKALEDSKSYKELSQSLQEKLQAVEAEKQKVAEQQQRQTIKSTAEELARGLFEGKIAKLVAREIQDRLKFTPDGVMVCDNDGKLTAASLKDLADEFKTDPDYQQYLIATKASVGGANTPNTVKPAGGGASNKTFKQMSVAEKVAYLESKKR